MYEAHFGRDSLCRQRLWCAEQCCSQLRVGQHGHELVHVVRSFQWPVNTQPWSNIPGGIFEDNHGSFNCWNAHGGHHFAADVDNENHATYGPWRRVYQAAESGGGESRENTIRDGIFPFPELRRALLNYSRSSYNHDLRCSTSGLRKRKEP